MPPTLANKREMKKAIVTLIRWLLSSFDNRTPGASGRKLTACALMVCVFYLHYAYVTPKNAVEFLIADLSTISSMLGIVTAQNIIDFRIQKKEAKHDKD